MDDSLSHNTLIACHYCGQVNRWSSGNLPEDGRLACPRCGSFLQQRKTNSLSRTWAFLLSAVICYIPANLLPVMHTESLLGREDDTILSGIIYLWTSGSWELAVLVFIASIMVPLLKLISLAFLASTVHFRWKVRRRSCQRLYRIVEAVGRWSMLDIFVVALMVALVQFRSLAIIEAGPGAIAFGAVVVLTILAAMSFDCRLLWEDDKRER